MKQKKDYWFSVKAKARGEALAADYPELFQHKCCFKGQEFTEQIDHGCEPITNRSFDDNVFIGTGTDKDCTYTNPNEENNNDL